MVFHGLPAFLLFKFDQTRSIAISYFWGQHSGATVNPVLELPPYATDRHCIEGRQAR